MPIYEYRCSSCGKEVEALQKLSEPPLVECPACHQQTLTKLVSAAGFQLKGSGWYVTDFRNGSKPAAKAESKTGNGDTAKADGAPAGDSKSAEGKATETKAAESKPAATTAPATPTTSGSSE